MKRLLILAFLIQACGTKNQSSGPVASTGPCSGTQVGAWSAQSHSNILVLDAQCNGTTTYCGETFTYAWSGTTVIASVTKTNGGPECMTLGSHSLSVSYIGGGTNIMAVTTSGGVAIQDNFNRQ